MNNYTNLNYYHNFDHDTFFVARPEKPLEPAVNFNLDCDICFNGVCICNIQSSRSISPISLTSTSNLRSPANSSFNNGGVYSFGNPTSTANKNSLLNLNPPFSYSSNNTAAVESNGSNYFVSNNTNRVAVSSSPDSEFNPFSLTKSIWSPVKTNSSGSNLSTLISSNSESPSTCSSYQNVNVGFASNFNSSSSIWTQTPPETTVSKFNFLSSKTPITPITPTSQSQSQNQAANYDYHTEYYSANKSYSNVPSMNNVLHLNIDHHLQTSPAINNPLVLSPAKINIPPNSKFFVIKSYNEVDVTRSYIHKVWSSTVLGNKRLDAAYKQVLQKDGKVFLFFSVNSSGQFCGVAEMNDAIDFNKTSDIWLEKSRWKGVFPLNWIFVKNINNHHFKHLKIPQNEFKPVTNSRDTQEIPFNVGLVMLEIFKHQNVSSSFLQMIK